jgi:hypothetical protein
MNCLWKANATKPNPFEIISLQTTRKENSWKTEETLARAVVTLETKRIKGSNIWWLWWWLIGSIYNVFFWLFPRRLSANSRRFGTHYRFHIQRHVYEVWQGLGCVGYSYRTGFRQVHCKVVSPKHRPPLPPRKYSWYSFLLESESTPGP